MRIRDGAPVGRRGGLRPQASGIGCCERIAAVRPSRVFLDNTSLAADAPSASATAPKRSARADQIGDLLRGSGRIAAFDHGDMKYWPRAGEADNVGDGFLFGGEKHGPAAPFAGRAGFDPEGVAHFGFVSFGRPSSGARLGGRAVRIAQRCNGGVVAKLLLRANLLIFAANLIEVAKVAWV